MIIHSAEYFKAMRQEMQGFLSHVEKQIYSESACFLKQGIRREIEFCDLALSSQNCITCINKRGAVGRDGLIEKGGSCALNGTFPPGFNLGDYCCANWVWDDIPF